MNAKEKKIALEKQQLSKKVNIVSAKALKNLKQLKAEKVPKKAGKKVKHHKKGSGALSLTTSAVIAITSTALFF